MPLTPLQDVYLDSPLAYAHVSLGTVVVVLTGLQVRTPSVDRGGFTFADRVTHADALTHAHVSLGTVVIVLTGLQVRTFMVHT